MKLTRDEYQRRLDYIRSLMAEEGLSALIVYSWKRGQVRYLSGYCPDYIANVAMAIVPQDEEPSLLIRFPFDVGRARTMTWIRDVRASGDLMGLARDCAQIIRDQGLAVCHIGMISGDLTIEEMPFSLYQEIQRELPKATLVPAFEILQKARLLKSQEEFNLLIASAAVADVGMEVFAAALPSAQTDQESIAATEASVRARGAEEWLAVISTTGSGELVGPPKSSKFVRNETVILEFGLRYGGYWTQVARTFALRPPSPKQKEAYRIAFEAYQAGVSAARPGNTISDVARAQLKEVETAGWADYAEYDLGHGIGLDLPEAPAIHSDQDMLLQRGMALVIHQGLRRPGVAGAFVGGTIVISERGAIPLHKVPSTLSPLS